MVVKIILNVLAEKQLEIMQTLLSLIEPVGKEKGCKSYSVSCDINDRNRFCLMEEWETRDDMDHHIRSRRFGVLLGTKSLLSVPLDIRIYTIARLQGIEAVDSLRKKGVSYDEYTADLS